MPLCVFVCACVRLRKRVCEQMSEEGGGGGGGVGMVVLGGGVGWGVEGGGMER